MANALIHAKNVVGGNTVRMDVSGTSARIAVGSPYVRMTARNIGAPFAVRYVRTAKGGVNVKNVGRESS